MSIYFSNNFCIFRILYFILILWRSFIASRLVQIKIFLSTPRVNLLLKCFAGEFHNAPTIIFLFVKVIVWRSFRVYAYRRFSNRLFHCLCGAIFEVSPWCQFCCRSRTYPRHTRHDWVLRFVSSQSRGHRPYPPVRYR